MFVRRKDLSIYICAGIFIFLTAFKLLFPQSALAATDMLSGLVDRNGNFRQTALLCSELISQTDETITEAFSRNYEDIETDKSAEAVVFVPETKVKPYMPENYYILRNIALMNVNRDMDAEPAMQQEEVYTAAVEAFKQSQENYSHLELPENVSYDYMNLGLDWQSPVAGSSSSGFGYRLHPIQGVVKFHYGTDFSAEQYEEITAFASGTVITARYSDSYGYYILIEHENNCSTLYAHCSELLVTEGENVALGQTIALVGATGLATGPHLHFELTCCGVYLNPEYYVNSGEVL